jgi:hypothetical protein
MRFYVYIGYRVDAGAGEAMAWKLDSTWKTKEEALYREQVLYYSQNAYTTKTLEQAG